MYIYIYIDTYTGHQRKEGKKRAWPRCKNNKEENNRVEQERHCTAISRCENCIAAKVTPVSGLFFFFNPRLMYTRVCIELPSGLARCAHPPPHNPINGCRAPLHARLAHRHAPTWLANLLTSPPSVAAVTTAVVHRRGHACAISLELLPPMTSPHRNEGAPLFTQYLPLPSQLVAAFCIIFH